MIYLDYNATTPTDPRVVEAMLPFLREHHGNPSSSHAAGRRVREAVEHARSQVAELIRCEATELIFTSGGTESNNHVIRGAAHVHRDKRPHIVISAVEHPAVDRPCRFLESYGVETTRVPVDGTGRLNPDDVERAIRPDTVLVSVMLANNEVGTLQPVAEIARVARERGIVVHTDAAQAVGKLDVDVSALGVDFLSVAGHKLYAPLGVGALYIRKGVELPPFMHGAGHEGGRRAGTEAVPAIIGLGAAAEICAREMDFDGQRRLRDRLWEGLREQLGERIRLHGHPTERLPNTLNIGFLNLIGSEILAATPDVLASAGAACHGGGLTPSAVLTAMGIETRSALGAVRFSVGRFTTAEHVDGAVERIAATVRDALRRVR